MMSIIKSLGLFAFPHFCHIFTSRYSEVQSEVLVELRLLYTRLFATKIARLTLIICSVAVCSAATNNVVSYGFYF